MLVTFDLIFFAPIIWATLCNFFFFFLEKTVATAGVLKWLLYQNRIYIWVPQNVLVEFVQCSLEVWDFPLHCTYILRKMFTQTGQAFFKRFILREFSILGWILFYPSAVFNYIFCSNVLLLQVSDFMAFVRDSLRNKWNVGI